MAYRKKMSRKSSRKSFVRGALSVQSVNNISFKPKIGDKIKDQYLGVIS